MGNTKYPVAIERADNYELKTIKSSLRRMFDSLGYDDENPLGHIIKPGMRVFIKPNWVASRWRESCPHKDDIYCVITHTNVIEAVADYVALALQGEGEIIIGDNPTIDADFEELMTLTGIRRLENKYDVKCTVLDLRPLVCKDLKDYGKKDRMVGQEGDPSGHVLVNLGRQSMLYNVNPKLFRGVFNEREETIAAHTGETQLYAYSRMIYDSDVYISIPKMKTHHKAGVTLNLKGLVGAISVKNHLVHWRVGFPLIGGDEYPNFFAWLKGHFAKVKERGAWCGNDTIWRMVVDVYHGMMLKERKYFSVVDGIIGGEGKGPLCPYSKYANTLVCGEDLLSVDIATTRLMGFDPALVPYIKYFLKSGEISLDAIDIRSNEYQNQGFFESENEYLGFLPSEHWKILRKDKRWRV